VNSGFSNKWCPTRLPLGHFSAARTLCITSEEGLLLLILVRAYEYSSFFFPRFKWTVLIADSTSHAGELTSLNAATGHGEEQSENLQ